MIAPDWPLYARRGLEMARLMRWIACAAVVLAAAPSAFAADLDVLRGSEPTYHWGGFYGGAQLGFSSAVMNFSQTTNPAVAFILRNTQIEQDEEISQWDLLGSRTPSSTSLGGFVGYNSEWEDFVLGLELNYNRTSLSASSSGGIGRSFIDSNNLPTGHHYFYDVASSGQASLNMSDIATFRARAGWEAGNFLPYTFVGFALGRADLSTSATASYTAVDVPDPQTPPTPQLVPLADLSFGPFTKSNTENGAFLYGVAAGVGADIAMTQNIFVRGEFEYIYFAPIDHISVSVTSARVGAGYKF
jgi:outer membrane immunogenic protein